MKRLGLNCVAVSAAWIGLLAGCAPHQNAEHGLTAESRLRVADAAEVSGDKQTARSMYAAAANDSPNDTQTQLRSAEGLARNGGLDDAAALLARRLKTTPHDPELLRTLGAIQIMSGEPGRAILTLSDVLEAKPDDAKALVNKAVALDILHKHDEAQALYRKAATLLPDDMTIANDLALSLLLSGQRDAARLTLLPFRDARELPERVKTNIGILDAATGHPVEAGQMLSSRIASADLASLTQAISMQGGSFQPDSGRRIVSRGVLTEPVVPYAEPVAGRAAPSIGYIAPAAPRVQPAVPRAEPVVLQAAPRIPPAGIPAEPAAPRAEPVVVRAAPVVTPAGSPPSRGEPAVIRRPLQEQTGPHAVSAVSREEAGTPRTESPTPLPASAEAKLRDVPVVSPKAPPALPPTRAEVAARNGEMPTQAPVREDLVPSSVRATRVDAATSPRSMSQEPVATLADPAVSTEAAVRARRPLQEQVTRPTQPMSQSDIPAISNRPVQELSAGVAKVLPR